ncbi:MULTISPECIES: LacI family DNA-binding transcriptional regulator [unclassified Novosphingobium]|uniref:LacI family DNA-binding transcriptional regulator n=1 Tax=unclassified Novosphingobium TaxID=2644732 RepID=UPI000EC126FE|nr:MULTISPECIES: LacI family DNA-binding transcriptional regulator [unclassified Novosphingobium]HCF24008.1 LacI family transcriptional regulator [Novosphingobium sp.]HQV03547.1 LacI family DNA-binding transcriptional regulator [Novosphingobium sp.]
MGENADKPKPRPFRVTSFDVAAEAGVSQSTVSRALAGDPVVSEATRLRVAEAARRLNYYVDNNAARLRTGKTGTLAVVVICRPDEDRKDLNPFTYALLGSICAAASARGYETLVSFQDGPANLAGRYEEQRKADGLIVIGTTQNEAAWNYYRELGQSGMHWVCWGSPYDDLEWIRSDNHEGARLATGHLIERGCGKIACIGSVGSLQRQFKERWDGYSERMERAGLDPWLIEIEDDLPREEQGRRAARALLAAGRPCDGIFAVCDEIALGTLRELSDLGIKVPADIALIGFDGIKASANAMPPLSTVQPDFAAAGAMMIDKLLASVAGDSHEQRRVPVQLLVRESTRRG